MRQGIIYLLIALCILSVLEYFIPGSWVEYALAGCVAIGCGLIGKIGWHMQRGEHGTKL